MQLLRVVRSVVLFSLLTGVLSFAQTFTTLLSFDETNGSSPSGPLVLGSDGNYYGTTVSGGTDDFGTFFKVTAGGTPMTLYSFLCSPASCADGYSPQSLVLSSDGDFYGVTFNGGVNGHGTVFKVTPVGVLTTLYSFCVQQNCPDGVGPNGPLVQGRDGNFYGTTYSGGTAGGIGGAGTVFKITPGGTLTTLHSFCFQAHCADGQLPVAGLAQGRDGDFYGTTPYGGANFYGTAFKITPAGTLTVLHDFNQTDGAYPQSPLAQGTDGSLYGTTYQGGSSGDGTVFRMNTAGTLTTLANFDNTNGENPLASALVELGGNFYGTTARGGTAQTQGGTIFKITTKGVLTALYNFCSEASCDDGSDPNSIMLMPTGVFYGTTLLGGTSNYGTLFLFNPFTGSVQLNPDSGNVGAKVRITGSGFSGATSVSFNGTPAKFTVVSSSEIATTVPPGAVSGPVIVTTPTGTLASAVPFLVKPQIKSFMPGSGPIGTKVTITGVSLTQTIGVAFGGTTTTVFSVNTDTKLIATVPRGALTGPIKITTKGGTVTSKSNFAVTP